MQNWFDFHHAGEGYEDPRWAGIWQEAEEVWNEHPATCGAVQEQAATEGGLLDGVLLL